MSNYRDCKHGQLARSCNLCEAAAAVKAAYIEGFSSGFEACGCNNGDDPLDQLHWPKSNAKTDSESI